MTDPTRRFSSKAEKYARYRWDYAPQAIQTIVEYTGLSTESTVADVGLGTGILTKHFVAKVQCVYAIEPNPEMRVWSEKALCQYPSYRSIAGEAEATTLPDHTVDLISAGTALHWFRPEATKREFVRILKPGGWLAILWNQATNEDLGVALDSISTEQFGWDTAPRNALLPANYENYYLREDDFFKANFLQEEECTWDIFFGALCSSSYSPDEDHPLYTAFQRAAREVFDRFSDHDRLIIPYTTELILGKIQTGFHP